MLNPHLGLEHTKDSFDDETLSQQEFIKQWHEMVFLTFAYSGDKLYAFFPQSPAQFFGNISLVTEQFSLQIFRVWP